jgi:hypothetical protein
MTLSCEIDAAEHVPPGDGRALPGDDHESCLGAQRAKKRVSLAPAPRSLVVSDLSLKRMGLLCARVNVTTHLVHLMHGPRMVMRQI